MRRRPRCSAFSICSRPTCPWLTVLLLNTAQQERPWQVDAGSPMLFFKCHQQAPAPKPKPAPLPVTPISDMKKKKKRKQVGALNILQINFMTWHDLICAVLDISACCHLSPRQQTHDHRTARCLRRPTTRRPSRQRRLRRLPAATSRRRKRRRRTLHEGLGFGVEL